MAEQEKIPPKICTDCKKRPARAKGLCQACNMKQKRAKETPRQRATRKQKAREHRDTSAQQEAAAGELPTDAPGDRPPEWEAPSDLPPLTGEQRDRLLVRASTRGPEPVDLTVNPREMSHGYFQLWTHVKSHDAIFRRDIIRRLQALGMDNLSILATFIAEPALRKRWVDPLRDPAAVFKHDFKLLRTATLKTGRTASVSLRDYIERLGLIMRMAFEVAADGDAPATVRKDMLILSGKLARDIALLEDAIKPIPGAGDVPSQRVYKGSAAADDGDEEDEENEEPGGFSLPEIRTGEGEE